MSDNDRIDTLITELKGLRIQETALIQQIEEANRQRAIGQVNRGTRDDKDTTGDARPTYQVGDRVYITSRIRRPVFASGAWTGYKERRATVTKIVGEKVYVKTDNDTKTWRAAKNLRLLSPVVS